MLDTVLWTVSIKDKQDKCGFCFPGASVIGTDANMIETDTSPLWLSSVGKWRAGMTER